MSKPTNRLTIMAQRYVHYMTQKDPHAFGKNQYMPRPPPMDQVLPYFQSYLTDALLKDSQDAKSMRPLVQILDKNLSEDADLQDYLLQHLKVWALKKYRLLLEPFPWTRTNLSFQRYGVGMFVFKQKRVYGLVMEEMGARVAWIPSRSQRSPEYEEIVQKWCDPYGLTPRYVTILTRELQGDSERDDFKSLSSLVTLFQLINKLKGKLWARQSLQMSLTDKDMNTFRQAMLRNRFQ
jgi:hypothetical protein